MEYTFHCLFKFSSISFCFHTILCVRVDTHSSILQSILVSTMSRPIRVQGVGQVACPACGQLFSARGGISLHYHNSPQCLPTASAAVGIGCQERRSNVGNIVSSVNAPIAPAVAQHQPADSTQHDSDEAGYPNADNEGSDLDTILPGSDCAAIDHGNSQLAVTTQQGVIESLKVKYQAYLNSALVKPKSARSLRLKLTCW